MRPTLHSLAEHAMVCKPARNEEPGGKRVIGVTSSGMLAIPCLHTLLGDDLRRVRSPRQARSARAIAGWGAKPSGARAQAMSQRLGLPALFVEDGFLRSWGTGDRFPPLSVVVDDLGIYYDSTRPSAIERLLASDADVLAGIGPDVARAKGLILLHRLSKYNHAPDWQETPRTGARVLVVDQTAGDKSVALGGARADTFAAMLAAARAENPGATVYVKTHPEVASGRKGGYLTQVQDDAQTVVLRQAINPLSLIEHMDRVYVVSSTMGFEALLAGKPVTCFGLPWYAGWGCTEDRQHCPRRTRSRNLDELFAAGYFHYARYLDPVTRRPGSIFDAIDWLVRQRAKADGLRRADGTPRQLICVGFRRWKAANLRPMLALDPSQAVFVRDAAAAARRAPAPGDALLFWGTSPPAGLQELASARGARLVRMEDGFLRSVGLGSDLIRPLSLVLDNLGIYFDPRVASDLEQLLEISRFSDDELVRAARVREAVVRQGITKYNLEPRNAASWPTRGRPVVLVPGQVEDDASIRFGCTDVRTNLALLRAAREARPDAYLVYKPHPDVKSGNRAGRMAIAEARRYADHVETRLSVVSCIDASEEVHTMTSLTGFDALLRGRKVVTYGQPFYAGWGLTHDKARDGAALARRRRRLALDELVAGTLLRYPLYWDWELKGYTTCEAVLARLVETRDALESNGGLKKLQVGFLRRQGRKLRVLGQAWLAG